MLVSIIGWSGSLALGRPDKVRPRLSGPVLKIVVFSFKSLLFQFFSSLVDIKLFLTLLFCYRCGLIKKSSPLQCKALCFTNPAA